MRTCQWCGTNYSHFRMTHPGATDYCSDKCENEARANSRNQSIFQGSQQDPANAAGGIAVLAVLALACIVGLFFLPYMVYGWLFHGMEFSIESLFNSLGNIWAWVISLIFWLAVGLVIDAIRRQGDQQL